MTANLDWEKKISKQTLRKIDLSENKTAKRRGGVLNLNPETVAVLRALQKVAPLQPAATPKKKNAQMTFTGSFRYQREIPPRQLVDRACLGCENKFKSEGSHHRMCRSCRHLPEG